MIAPVHEVRYGTAGWSFPDWYGPFYPQRTEQEGPGALFSGVLDEAPDPDLVLARREPLRYYARFFDAVEVNASFYGVPRATSAARWVEQTRREGQPFLFTAKLPQSMSHHGAIEPGELQAFRDFLAPLSDQGRLAGVLAQFPPQLAWSPSAAARVDAVRAALPDEDLVVEVRHASWQRPEALEFLVGIEASLANIDMPQGRDTLPPAALVTRPALAYVRLHGRNAAAWFDPRAGRDQRYDYLYQPDELAGWAQRIETLSQTAKRTLVIANNHYRGQAPANALELRRLAGAEAPAPRALVRTYPRLAQNRPQP